MAASFLRRSCNETSPSPRSSSVAEVDAATALERGESSARTEGRRLALHNVLMLKAAVMIAKGDFAEAKRLARAVRDIGDPQNVVVALDYAAQITAIRAEQGEATQVLDEWADAIEHGVPGTATWRTMLAALHADLGHLDAAAEGFDALAASNFAAIPRDWSFPLAVRYLPEICAQLGDSQRVAQLLPEVEAYRGQLLVVNVGTSIEGAADRSLGQLYALLDRHREADRHFESAYRLETSMGFAPLSARTRYWHARLLRPTGARGDDHGERARTPTGRGTATRLQPRHGPTRTPSTPMARSTSLTRSVEVGQPTRQSRVFDWRKPVSS